MSHGTAIDYDALAAQSGGVAASTAIDYDKLAAEHGGTAAQGPKPDTGVLASLKRTASGIWNLPGTIIDAFEKAPTDNEKMASDALAKTMGIPGGSAAARAVLPLHRLIIQPMVENSIAADEAEKKYNALTPEQQAADRQNDTGFYHTMTTNRIASMVPLGGQMAEAITHRYLSGDKSGAITDLATAVAGPKVAEGATSAAIKAVNRVAPAIAERLYTSALKPSTTIPAAQRTSIVQTGLDAGIPVSEDGAAKLSGLIGDLNQKIKAQIQSAGPRPINYKPAQVKGLLPAAPEEISVPASDPTRVGTLDAPMSPASVIQRPAKAGAPYPTMDSGVTIDPRDVVKRLDQIKSKFANQVNPDADLAAIDAAKQEFLKNNPDALPAAQAQAMKQGTYAQLKGRAYGELKSATVESQKALALGLKEELENHFPEIKGMNAQTAKFYGLQEELSRAVNRVRNHNLLGLGPTTAAAAGAAAGAVAGHPLSAMTGGAIVKAIMDDPAFKSKLAIAISKTGKVPPSVAFSRIGSFANVLAQSLDAGANQVPDQSQ